jgi:hypothetical protein
MSQVKCDLYNKTISHRNLATSRTYIDKIISFITHRVFLLGAMILLYPLIFGGLCGYKVLTAVFVQL